MPNRRQGERRALGRRLSVAAIAAAFLLAGPVRALEGDPEGAGDHPLIKRYAGATIIGYDHRAFDAFDLPTGPQQRNATGRIVLESSLAIEGRHTRIIYSAPPNRSTLEVFGNYERALTEAGFEPLFRCAGEQCGERGLLATHILYAPDRRLRTLGPITEFAFSFPLQPHYLSARLPRDEGDIYVSLYVARENFEAFRETQNRALVLLDVIEPATMEDRINPGGIVNFDGAEILAASDAPPAAPAGARAEPLAAGAIEAALRSEGRIAVYAIEFASGSADLTGASHEAIAEIARMLGTNPDISLFVVGHSDNEGGYELNLSLSQKRAEAVVSALVENQLIDRDRLTAAGVGMLVPVASNATEEGRALNRRVELVVR